MSYLDLLRLAAPEAIVVITALIVLALGLARPAATTLCSAVAALGLIAAAVVAATLPAANLFGGMLVISPLTALFHGICLTLALFAVILMQGDGATRRHHAEYVALLLFATLGLMLLISSEELLMIFIGLELTGLALYLMTAFDKTNARSAEAGMKYFLFGSTASAFTLFGLSLVYGFAGSTALAALGEKLTAQPIPPLLAAGIVMTLVGFAFKVAAAPFHVWAADAYQGGPMSSAAFIASASKVAAFVVLGKLVLAGFGALQGSAAGHAMTPGWAPLLAVLAALSIVIGNLVALAQTNVRRLLAYSAVAHAGYTLVGIISGRAGFSATLFYTTAYAFTLVGAFGVIARVRAATGGDDITHFRGLSTRAPLLAGCMAIFLLSLAGLPPLGGFFGKFYLFSAALGAEENHGLLWLVALALLGSLVSLYYYLVVLRTIFVEAASSSDAQAIISPSLQRIALTILAAAVVLLGTLPATLVARIVAVLE